MLVEVPAFVVPGLELVVPLPAGLLLLLPLLPPQPAATAATSASTTLSAVSVVCGVTGLLGLLGRKPRAWPFAGLAVALILWGALGPHVTNVFWLAGGPSMLLALGAAFIAAPDRLERPTTLPARAYLMSPTYVIALAGGIWLFWLS